MTKFVLVIFFLILGVLSGIFQISKGYKKIKETGDRSFRFLNLFSNEPVKGYSGYEHIFLGIATLGFVSILIVLIFF